MNPSMSRAARLAGLALSLAATTAAADWTGKAELGAVLARGNTESDTVAAKFDTAYTTGLWKHAFGASLLSAATDSVTTADRWELREQSDYTLSERSYLFGALRYEDDEFSAYAYQGTISGGYGYKFIDTEATKFRGQIGAGYRSYEAADTGETGSDAIARGDIYFEHLLTSTTRIIDKFLVEAGADNTFLQNELSLEVKMTDALALGVTLAVRHNTDVPVGIENTDTVLTANLVYGF